VIPFIQKIWFLWWIVAPLFILRWFHLFSSRTDERDLEAADSAKEEASTASKQIPSGAPSRLFT
jgi:hypothetical protein